MPARSPTVALAAAVALALTLTGSALAGCGRGADSTSASAGPQAQSSGFDGAELGEQPRAPGFTLTDQHGNEVSLSHYHDSVVLVSFLYSTCGPTCMLVAQQIRGALDELARSVPVLLVSAKPSADTPASVARFLSAASLSARAEYLTGPLSRLRALWRAYRVTPPETDVARFRRAVGVVLIDARGRERVAYGLEQLTPEALAHDIRLLQRG